MNRIALIIVPLLALVGCASSSALKEQALEAQSYKAQAEECRKSALDAEVRVNTLIDSNNSLISRNNELREQVSLLNVSITECEFRIREREDDYKELEESLTLERSELEAMRAELAPAIEVSETNIARARAASVMYDDLRALLGEDSEDISIAPEGPALTIVLSNSMLYDTVDAHLSAGGRDVLEKLAESLKRLGFTHLQAGSYADNIPPGGSLAERFPTNWHLTAFRAASVVDYLAALGITPALMQATGMADNSPVADNDTKEGRALNRRLVITITPAVDEHTSTPREE